MQGNDAIVTFTLPADVFSLEYNIIKTTQLLLSTQKLHYTPAFPGSTSKHLEINEISLSPKISLLIENPRQCHYLCKQL
jgi:hypothetical protein